MEPDRLRPMRITITHSVANIDRPKQWSSLSYKIIFMAYYGLKLRTGAETGTRTRNNIILKCSHWQWTGHTEISFLGNQARCKNGLVIHLFYTCSHCWCSVKGSVSYKPFFFVPVSVLFPVQFKFCMNKPLKWTYGHQWNWGRSEMTGSIGTSECAKSELILSYLREAAVHG